MKFYQYVRAFSLDVVAGAMISAHWVGVYFNAQIPFIAFIALGITVWSIYTIDHLLDARKLRCNGALFRHRFHQKNAPYLAGLTVAASILLVFLLWNLDSDLLWCGAVLGIVVICYLGFVHFIRRSGYWGKEWFISIVYSTGICLPAFAYIQSVPLELVYFWVQFFMLASINLILFNMIEYGDDRLQGFSSFATVKGVDLSRRVLLLLLFSFCVIWFLSFALFPLGKFLYFQAVFILMAAVLALVLSKEVLLRRAEWYRVIGDLVFVFPLIEISFTDA